MVTVDFRNGSVEVLWRRVAIVASTIVMTICTHAQTASSKVAPDFAAAQKSFAEKRYKEAADQFAVVADHADDPQVRLASLLLESKSLINLDNFKAAESTLNKYLSAKPESPEALYLLGYVLERENKARESLVVYNRAATLARPQPNDLKLVALDYVLLNDYPNAILWLKRCLAEDPANSEAWYFLGRAHMQGGEFVEAEKNFRRTLELTPHDSKALDNLGLSLEAQNRNGEAAKAYTDAVVNQKGQVHESEQPLLNLGTLLNNENRSAEALPYLKRSVQLAPASVRCQEELSRAFSATGDSVQGIAAMEKAVTLDGTNPRLHFLLGQLYRKAGQVEKASLEFQTSKRLYGDHSTNPER
jgi:Flp pilus assembly protein TadD